MWECEDGRERSQKWKTVFRKEARTGEKEREGAKMKMQRRDKDGRREVRRCYIEDKGNKKVGW